MPCVTEGNIKKWEGEMKSKTALRNSSLMPSGSKIISILILTTAFISYAGAQNIPRQRIAKGKADLRVAFSTEPAFRSEPVPLAAIRTLYINISNAGSVPAQDFYVDVFIVQNVPSNPFSRQSGTRPLPETRQLVKSVRAGGSTRIGIPIRDRLPRGMPAGEYVLGAVVDSTRKISELDESNNTAYLRVKFEQVLITRARQSYDYGGPEQIYLNIEGNGFGDTPGNKIIKVGSYELSIYEWSDIKVLGFVTLNQVSLGNSYVVYFADKSTKTRISNQISLELLARIYIVEPKEGAPGTEVELWVADRGGNTQGTKKVKMGTVEAPVTSWVTGEVIRITVPSLPSGDYELYLEDSGKVISQKYKYFKVL